MSSSMRCRSGLTDCWMDGSDIGSSSRAEGDPSCSEPDPDPLNLSSAHCWRCPLRRPRHPPAERVRTWAGSRPSAFRRLARQNGRSRPHVLLTVLDLEADSPCPRPIGRNCQKQSIFGGEVSVTNGGSSLTFAAIKLDVILCYRVK